MIMASWGAEGFMQRLRGVAHDYLLGGSPIGQCRNIVSPADVETALA